MRTESRRGGGRGAVGDSPYVVENHFQDTCVFNDLSLIKKVVTVGDSCSSVTNCHQLLPKSPPACMLLKIKKIKKIKEQVSPTVTRLLMTANCVTVGRLYVKKATVTAFIGDYIQFCRTWDYAGPGNFLNFFHRSQNGLRRAKNVSRRGKNRPRPGVFTTETLRHGGKP